MSGWMINSESSLYAFLLLFIGEWFVQSILNYPSWWQVETLNELSILFHTNQRKCQLLISRFKSLPAPRIVVIANGEKAEAVFVSNLVKNRKTKKYEFRREHLRICLRLPSKKLSLDLGVITNDVSHFYALTNQYGFLRKGIRSLLKRRDRIEWNWRLNGSTIWSQVIISIMLTSLGKMDEVGLG